MWGFLKINKLANTFSLYKFYFIQHKFYSFTLFYTKGEYQTNYEK